MVALNWKRLILFLWLHKCHSVTSLLCFYLWWQWKSVKWHLQETCQEQERYTSINSDSSIYSQIVAEPFGWCDNRNGYLKIKLFTMTLPWFTVPWKHVIDLFLKLLGVHSGSHRHSLKSNMLLSDLPSYFSTGVYASILGILSFLNSALGIDSAMGEGWMDSLNDGTSPLAHLMIVFCPSSIEIGKEFMSQNVISFR